MKTRKEKIIITRVGIAEVTIIGIILAVLGEARVITGTLYISAILSYITSKMFFYIMIKKGKLEIK